MVIADIVDKIVPATQKHIEEGMSIKEALEIEFNKLGYITDKHYWERYSNENRD